MKPPLLDTRLPQFPLPIPVVKFNLVGLMPQQTPPVVVVVEAEVVVVVDPSGGFSSESTSVSKLSTLVSIVLSPGAAPQSVFVSALVNDTDIFVPQAACFAESGGSSFAIPFASTPSTQLAFLPAAFSLAAWHLLGSGPTAISALRSLTKASTLVSIVLSLAPPGLQSLAPIALVKAVENLVSHAVSFAESAGRPFAAALANTAALQDAFFPVALTSFDVHLLAAKATPGAARNAKQPIATPASFSL